MDPIGDENVEANSAGKKTENAEDNIVCIDLPGMVCILTMISFACRSRTA